MNNKTTPAIDDGGRKIKGMKQDIKAKEYSVNESFAYQELFDFFSQEHNLTLLHSEIDDIIKAVDKFIKTYNGKYGK